MPHAILLIHCPDQPGLVRAVASFISENRGNIIQFDQHVDSVDGVFFMRVEWDLEKFVIPRADLPVFIRALAEPRQMTWSLHFTDERHRLALFVSREAHCLYDLLSRHDAGELDADIPVIVSNHEALRPAAERFGIPFHVIEVTRENKAAAEARQQALMKDHGIDTIVLARYMQILSNEFSAEWPNRVINIHHSFLPAFPGARPYHSAHARGVKIIGATSHYVTADLDEGPIIEQDVIRVSHKDTVNDLIRQGRDLEKVVLARAVRWHVQRKVLAFNNRTVVFS
ncbi:MAG TPA: formyltetrahydrofolate deformylase [Verrucomicrobiales bacterium]|jgi:formyltetrahydrofolate deformylase|nr:formyltetrahydrofolate deformylase [Verrucomicrobiales bacterium]